MIAELDDEIESLKANIEYIHENLTDCQTSIMQMEEAKARNKMPCFCIVIMLIIIV